MRKIIPIALVLTAMTATPAGSAPRPLLEAVIPAGSNGQWVADAVILSDGRDATEFAVPPWIMASIRQNSSDYAVRLKRMDETPATIVIGAGAFVRVRYTFQLPATVFDGNSILTVSAWGPQGVVFATSPRPARASILARTAVAPTDPSTATSPHYETQYRSPDNDHGNRFLPNLTAYEPIYAVYGPGTDTDARLQISFKYQLFGDARDGDGSWLDKVHFAFTQRLYWDLGAQSSPFRNVDYMPELMYLIPGKPVSSTMTLGGQAGFRHESNGRDGSNSRSLNTLYLQPVASLRLGDTKLTIGPRIWLYAGRLSDNPDIRHYRGNTGFMAEIGRDDGVRLTTTSRFNFGSGKGALDVLLSYPLDKLLSKRLKLYAFSQGFVGYGENLLDYNRYTTRLRIGIGIVR